MGGLALGLVWDLYQGSQLKKELELKFEELREYILQMSPGEANDFAQKIGFEVHDHILEFVEDHHQEIGLEDWSID